MITRMWHSALATRRIRNRDARRAAGFSAVVGVVAACDLLQQAHLNSARASATVQTAIALLALAGALALMLLLVGIGAYRADRQVEIDAARHAERERIVRDLHDGLSQDLATIALYAEQLTTDLGEEHPLSVAARNALAVARGKVLDLAASDEPSLAAALDRVAGELSGRLRIHVAARVTVGDEAAGRLEYTAREDIVRIAREAIVNAATHGGAENVLVTLDAPASCCRLRISDDGHPSGDPFLVGVGLSTMRARAASLGGTLTVRGGADGGTEVEMLIGGPRPTPVRAPRLHAHAVRRRRHADVHSEEPGVALVPWAEPTV